MFEVRPHQKIKKKIKEQKVVLKLSLCEMKGSAVLD